MPKEASLGGVPSLEGEQEPTWLCWLFPESTRHRLTYYESYLMDQVSVLRA